MRADKVDRNTMFFYDVPSIAGGCDRETPAKDLPDDCCRLMRDACVPSDFMFGQRAGTKVVFEVYDPSTSGKMESIANLHQFVNADQNLSRLYITANTVSASNKQIQWMRAPGGTLTLVRDDLTRNSSVVSDSYSNSVFYTNGVQQPWVTRHTPWGSGKLWRPTGLAAPDTSACTATRLSGGSLSTGYYKYVIARVIEDGDSYVKSSISEDIVLSEYIDAGTFNNDKVIGRDDCGISGTYTETELKKYRVQIDNVGSTGPVTSIADAGGGKIRVASVDHGLVAGQTVVLQGGTGYDETYTIDNVSDGNHFDVAATFVATGTGTWIRPDTFAWSSDGTTNWTTSGVYITAGSAQILSDGISVLFDTNSGHTLDDMWTYQVSGRKLKLTVPIESDDNVTQLKIYRTTPLETADAAGVFYGCKTVYRSDDLGTDWKNGYTEDDGAETLDYDDVGEADNNPPPTGAVVVLHYLEQMLYIGPPGYRSTIFPSKIGQPEQCPDDLQVPVGSANGSMLTGGFVDINGNCIVTKESTAYSVRRWTGSDDDLDYSQIQGGVGALSQSGICQNPYGVHVLGRGNIYQWNGSNFQPLINKYGISAKKFIENVPISDLRTASLGWDEKNNQLILTYKSPDLEGVYNNCQLVYQFESKRWIWFWTWRANCFCSLYDDQNYQRLWYGSSDDGTVIDADYGNFDKVYNIESRPLWTEASGDAPIDVPAGAERGTWGPGHSKWASGDQIHSEVWLGEKTFGSSFYVKALDYLLADLAPLPENQLEISIWDRGVTFITAYVHQFTQAQGFDVAKFDWSTFDAEEAETIAYPWPEITEGRVFQLRFRFPLFERPRLLSSSIKSLNDIEFSRDFNSATSLVYRVEIQEVGTLDKFKWSEDGGETWKAENVPISGTWQDLSNNLKVRFMSTTGHTLGDRWDYKVSQARRVGGRWKVRYVTLTYHNIYMQVTTAPGGV